MYYMTSSLVFQEMCHFSHLQSCKDLSLDIARCNHMAQKSCTSYCMSDVGSYMSKKTSLLFSLVHMKNNKVKLMIGVN